MSPTGLKFKISWDQFHRDTKALAAKLKQEDIRSIVAVARGGLIPASLLSYELGIRFIDTVCLESYTDDNKQEHMKVHDWMSYTYSTSKTLFVDDLVDTGSTFKFLQQDQDVQKCLFAAVYAKPKGRPFTDYFVTEVSQDTWIELPWD